MTYTLLPADAGLKTLDKVDLCYFDPPYNTGRDFYNFDDRFSSSQEYREGLIRPVLEALHPRLTGCVVIHVEPRISHHIRLVCDDVFGENRFVNEIVWKSGGNHHTEKKLQRSHDTIIVYSKKATFTFNPEYKPYDDKLVDNSKRDERGPYQTSALKNSQPDVVPRPNLRYEWNGHLFQWHVSREKMETLHNDNRLEYNNNGVPRVKRYFHELHGIPVKDVWDDISQIQMGEKLNYATQKPVKLLERIIRMYSNPGDLVVDPFAGSGTTGRAALRTGREYQLFDINPDARVLFYENMGAVLPF